MSQPDPVPNASRPVWELVIEDMRARDHAGRARYNIPLQAGNGRDALTDAYEEALDLCVYLRQVLAERAARAPVPAPLFEAALAVLRDRYTDADWARLQAVSRRDEVWTQDTAERLIRQAAAGGVAAQTRT